MIFDSGSDTFINTLLFELNSYNINSDFLFLSSPEKSKSKSDTTFIGALNNIGCEGRQALYRFKYIANALLNNRSFDERHIEAALPCYNIKAVLFLVLLQHQKISVSAYKILCCCIWAFVAARTLVILIINFTSAFIVRLSSRCCFEFMFRRV